MKRFFQFFITIWAALFVISTALIWINVYFGLPAIIEFLMFMWRSFLDAIIYSLIGPHQTLGISMWMGGVLLDALTAAIFALVLSSILTLLTRRRTQP